MPHGDILRLRSPFHGSTVIFVCLIPLSHATRRRSERIGQGHAVHAGEQRSAARHTRLPVLLPLTGTARLNSGIVDRVLAGFQRRTFVLSQTIELFLQYQAWSKTDSMLV